MTWVLLLLLLMCSGIVSGSETALFALTRQDLRTLSKKAYVLSKFISKHVSEAFEEPA